MSTLETERLLIRPPVEADRTRFVELLEVLCIIAATNRPVKAARHW